MKKSSFVRGIITFLSGLILRKPRRERDYGSPPANWREEYPEEESYI